MRRSKRNRPLVCRACSLIRSCTSFQKPDTWFIMPTQGCFRGRPLIYNLQQTVADYLPAGQKDRLFAAGGNFIQSGIHVREPLICSGHD
jgi:hypothetical protein